MLKTREVYAQKVGVTAPQFSILTVINERPGVYVNLVADILNVSGAFVTSEVGKLIKAGLLTKQTSGKDRRRMELHLTNEGSARFERATPERLAANQVIFEHFTDAELQGLGDDLQKLLAGLDLAVQRLDTPR
ncbi:MarR family winged helix-turn-helix transcriptional regulator [Acerihabitans sp. KWT182]|uniref:MarR family winged helix-turn-helix transcriptional regulator n=1 Tax=Acerihabitans sp. KWT182 TaxID=3157919 RepID=A0AAU7QCE4_9GAMM